MEDTNNEGNKISMVFNLFSIRKIKTGTVTSQKSVSPKAFSYREMTGKLIKQFQEGGRINLFAALNHGGCGR